MRGKTVIPQTSDYNVILWDDSCILGLSAILWRCSPTVYNNSIQRMYLIFGYRSGVAKSGEKWRKAVESGENWGKWRKVGEK